MCVVCMYVCTKLVRCANRSVQKAKGLELLLLDGIRARGVGPCVWLCTCLLLVIFALSGIYVSCKCTEAGSGIQRMVFLFCCINVCTSAQANRAGRFSGVL